MTPVDLEDRVRRTFATVVPALLAVHERPVARATAPADTTDPETPGKPDTEYVDVLLGPWNLADPDRPSPPRSRTRLVAAAILVLALAGTAAFAARQVGSRSPATPPTAPVTEQSISSPLPPSDTTTVGGAPHWLPTRVPERWVLVDKNGGPFDQSVVVTFLSGDGVGRAVAVIVHDGIFSPGTFLVDPIIVSGRTGEISTGPGSLVQIRLQLTENRWVDIHAAGLAEDQVRTIAATLAFPGEPTLSSMSADVPTGMSGWERWVPEDTLEHLTYFVGERILAQVLVSRHPALLRSRVTAEVGELHVASDAAGRTIEVSDPVGGYGPSQVAAYTTLGANGIAVLVGNDGTISATDVGAVAGAVAPSEATIWESTPARPGPAVAPNCFSGSVPSDAVRIPVGTADDAFFLSNATGAGGSPDRVCVVELRPPADTVDWSTSLTSPILDGFSAHGHGLVEADVATVRIYPADRSPIDAATHAVAGTEWRVWAADYDISQRVRAVDFLATDGHVIDHIGRPA